MAHAATARSAARSRRRTTAAAPEVDYDLRAIIQGFVTSLLERPPGELDPQLDAAIACFTRHGVRHTSVPDIARRLGVSRATLYRQVGSVDDFLRLVGIRELHRILDSLPDDLAHTTGADAFVALASLMVKLVVEHPVFQKVLADEPEALAELVPHVPAVLEAAVQTVAPFVASEMAAGRVRQGDPTAVAELVGRVILSAVFAPPDSDIHTRLTSILAPVLKP